MNDIETKLRRVHQLRDKFHHTLSDLKPRLTVNRLVDAAMGELMEKRRGSALISAAAVASAAWLINIFMAKQKSRPISNFKLPALKQETRNHESPTSTHRHSQNKTALGQKNRGAQD